MRVGEINVGNARAKIDGIWVSPRLSWLRHEFDFLKPEKDFLQRRVSHAVGEWDVERVVTTGIPGESMALRRIGQRVEVPQQPSGGSLGFGSNAAFVAKRSQPNLEFRLRSLYTLGLSFVRRR